MKTYNGSKGEVLIAEMAYDYLRNATIKSEKDRPGHPETIALRAELD